VQSKDDGTHTILPVTSPRECAARSRSSAVMMLRHSDGKMRRDGIRAARTQPDFAVDERGRLHGTPGLSCMVECRGLACIRGLVTTEEMKDEWVRTRKKLDRLGWQDKSRKVRPVGRLENAGDFKHAPNIAKIRHTLRFLQCRCSCSAFDTLWLMR